jgi:amidophosphoribosyltransferase
LRLIPKQEEIMSDQIKHECGIAFIRLLKPLSYYHKKYGTALYGLNKLFLLMQKERNRGQDGAGVATLKIGVEPGKRYISRHRSNNKDSIEEVFDHIHTQYFNKHKDKLAHPAWLKDNLPFMGELLLGHLRYGTHGINSIESCHPFLRQNNWISRNLVLAGNFNLTNVDELFETLTNIGQYPKEKSDTVTILEKIGHFLDEEVEDLYYQYKKEGLENPHVNEKLFKNLDVLKILKNSAKDFDGGYVMAGMIGHGDAFVMRDPGGIRPAYYYQDDEVVVVASERPAIQTTFNVHISKIQELPPAHAIIIKNDGRCTVEQFTEKREQTSCSFESIYFARGTDRDIYLERKKLGEEMADKIYDTVNGDLEHTVFSFIPNTAETSFLGLVQGLEKKLNNVKMDLIKEGKGQLTEEQLKAIMDKNVRVEKLIVKDAKLRTFIADDSSRDELVKHAYDVTYGIVENYVDTLVLLDDSIVRGTTLKKSIIRIAARLRPKKIIIISAAPQIRYPDCYGIDMSKMNDFVAFRALCQLLRDDKKEHLLHATYARCKENEYLPVEEIQNQVIELYGAYTQEQISKKISEIVTPDDVEPEVEVIYQTIEGLQRACPKNSGDWYFSGNYPTPGGNRVVNRAFMNFMEGKDKRAY